MRKLIYLVWMFPLFLLGIEKDIPVTRNLEPNRYQPRSYETYRAATSKRNATYQKIYQSEKEERNESFLVVIETNLYPQIQSAITIYQSDLENENLDAIIITFDGSEAEDLKEIITQFYFSDDIIGTLLIGNLPSAWFEMYNDFDDDGQADDDFVTFPLDLFYADLNGYWYDLDSNGVYDVHEGEVHPNIWVGRIKPDVISYVEEGEAIRAYFERNHLFRTGMLLNPNTGLAYIDDDWSSWGANYQANLEMVYPEVELINEINHTTAPDYRNNRLSADYEMIQVHVHSSPQAHYFYYNNGADYELVYNTELPIIEPTAYFYNLFCCSNAHFETPDNMGSLYLLANEHALGVIGSTKTGSMLSFENFYDPLSQQQTFGESFQRWWQQTVDTGSGSDWWERSWFYGMVFLGDPTLKVRYENENILFVDGESSGEEDGSAAHPFQTIQAAILQAEEGNEIRIASGVYHESINFLGKAITVRSIDGKETCIIDADQTETAVTFSNQEDESSVLADLTIRNGSGEVGGGIFCNSASPTIRNVNIANCFAEKGAALSAQEDSNPIFQQVYCHDNESIESGTIYLQNSTLSMENCLLVNNFSTGSSCFLLENASLDMNFSTICDNISAENRCLIADGELSIDWKNSIIWNQESSVLSFLPETGTAVFAISNCDLYDGSDAINTNGSGNIIWADTNLQIDPIFSENYHLTRYSQCLGAAQSEAEVGEDWLCNIRPNPVGSIPDMGAIESEYSSAALSLYHVSMDGSDTTGTGEAENPFASIQTAINTAFAGDSILVHPGEYSETIIWEEKPIHLCSEYYFSNDWADVEQTILNGNSSGSTLKIIDLEASSCIGFTIKNGNSSHGGGIALFNCDITLRNLIIKENSAEHGGGIFSQNSNSLFENVLIYANTASFDGGGISFFNSDNSIVNATIVDNFLSNGSENGANLYIVNSAPIILNSILYDETMPISMINSEPVIVYSDINPLIDGEGNLAENPELTETYTLSENSPCIDAGTNYFSWNDEIIIDTDDYVGSNPDMGCFEWSETGIQTDVYAHQSIQIENYPNPFNPSTTFSFSLTQDASVTLSLYNVRGQLIRVLTEDKYSRGKHQIIWEGIDYQNQAVSSGVYLYQLEVGKNTRTGRCLLIK